MPNLSESFEAAKARAIADFNEVKRQMQVIVDANTQLSTLVDEAAALDVTQTQEISDLKAERDALNQQIADAQAAIDAFDLDASFPAAPAPGDGGGTTPTEPPVATDPGAGAGNPPAPPAPGEDIPVGTGGQDIGGAPPAPPEVTNPDTAPQPSDQPSEGGGEPAGPNGGTGTQPTEGGVATPPPGE